MKKTQYIAVAATALLISSTAWAGALTIPNTFTAGTPAVAANVNANFTAVKTAVDDNNTRITTLQNFSLIRTINVSPVIGGGGVVDPVASGTALLNAVAAITGASASNPYLVKIEPGLYDLGNQGLRLASYVHLQGAGKSITEIKTNLQQTILPWVATVLATGVNFVSKLTITNVNTVSAPGFGVVGVGSVARLSDVIITGPAAGMSSFTDDGSTLTIENSTVGASAAGSHVWQGNAGDVVEITGSHLITPVSLVRTGTYKCFNVHSNFVALNATCM